jgi:hypothetical protein
MCGASPQVVHTSCVALPRRHTPSLSPDQVAHGDYEAPWVGCSVVEERSRTAADGPYRAHRSERVHNDALLGRPWACRAARTAVATAGLALGTPGCCRTALANHLGSRVLQGLLKPLQHTNVCPGKAGVGTAGILAFAQMEDRVWAMEVACFDCVAAARLWAHCLVTSATVTATSDQRRPCHHRR